MELITAQTLWKDYNPRNIPLSETVLSTEYTDKYSVKHVYFNGEATGDGCTRIYARLYSPASIPTGASAVLMNDIETPFDPTYIDMLIDCGYTVLALVTRASATKAGLPFIPNPLKGQIILLRTAVFTSFHQIPSFRAGTFTRRLCCAASYILKISRDWIKTEFAFSE